MIIDTHCHLDDNRYDEDIEDIINRAIKNGVKKFIIPGADPNTLEKSVSISEKFDEVYFAVGVHPYDAKNYDREFLTKFITHKKCIGVGECGLDYYRLPESTEDIENEKALQKKVFLDQIDLAKKYQKPLIVHIRNASHDCVNILEELEGTKGGVLHCYNADHELLKLAEHNFYFGIGGVLTFQNARKLVEVYPRIPLDKLLIETDAPYLTPNPHRGERNEPGFCIFVADKMASLSGISRDEIADITTKNAQMLFGI
ncbi:MAG: TatD family hydrolase [Sulfurovaceae bacterium]|nr:TatD family hydrolase [Sulfurovaceae bacterium]